MSGGLSSVGGLRLFSKIQWLLVTRQSLLVTHNDLKSMTGILSYSYSLTMSTLGWLPKAFYNCQLRQMIKTLTTDFQWHLTKWWQFVRSVKELDPHPRYHGDDPQYHFCNVTRWRDYRGAVTSRGDALIVGSTSYKSQLTDPGSL